MNKFIILFLIALPIIANAQSYAQDTVWTKKTDQSSGFYQVKFSNNDSIIVGHGYEFTIFYNALNGEEIMRIPGKSSVFFLDNDSKFIRANTDRSNFEIFDAKSFLLIDSLRNDGIHSSASVDISQDEKYLLTNIPNGFRIFDLTTKEILKTKIYPQEPNLIYSVVDYIFFVCNNNNFVAHRVRTYEDPLHPGDDKYYKIYGDYNLYDFNTFDSIGTYINARGMQKSNNCMYYAVATGDPTYGVEIYDFNTKQLLHRLPINGPSLTGIEFSPDDKYIVTSNGPGANSLIVWDVMTGTKLYGYTETSFTNIDLSNNGKYLIISVGRYLDLINTKFITGMIGNKENQTILYPNPTTGELNFTSAISFIEKIMIIDINGNEYFLNKWEVSNDGNIKIDVSNLLSGKYIIKIAGQNEIQSYNFIINK